jgi:hypothetical protein
MVAPSKPDKPIRVKVIGGEPDLKIDELYAIVAVGPKGEGIMACDMVIDGQLCFVPLVGADKERTALMVKRAKQIQAATDQPFRVMRFSNKEDVTDQFA